MNRYFEHVIRLGLLSPLFLAILAAQEGNRLATASLEELMNVEIQSFARKNQKLSQTAGAVYVITAEEIQRSGATVLPEVLRMVPGLHVARIDTGKWAISARGFTNRFANKMLVLIDGRSIYNSINGGVHWEEHDLPLNDIERIEVIRGPGATSWGANAVNGVINIITRRAQDTQGAIVAVTAGNDERLGAWNGRWGGHLGERFYYRLSGKATNLNSMTPSPGPAGANAWDLGRLHFRGDWELKPGSELLVQAGVSGMSGDQTEAQGFQLSGVDNWTRQRYRGDGHFALVRWRKQTERLETSLQFYTSHEERTQTVAWGRSRQNDFEFQQRWQVNRRNDLVWGLNYRNMRDGVTPGASRRVVFFPETEINHLKTAFVQDEISLWRDKLVLTLGSKFLSDTFAGFHVQPGARLLWSPSKQWSAWASVSRAVRLPTRYERGVRVDFAVPGLPVQGVIRGNPELEAERARSQEAGFRRQWSKRFSTDVAAFRTNYGGIIDLPIGQPLLANGIVFLPADFANRQTGCSWGTEVMANWEANSRLRIAANYSYLNLELQSTAQRVATVFLNSAKSTPAQLAHVRASGELSRRMSWDVWVYHTTKVDQERVPGFTRVDGRWAFRPRSGWEFSAGVRNALGGQQLEYPSEDLVRSTARRTAYVRLEWNWGGR